MSGAVLNPAACMRLTLAQASSSKPFFINCLTFLSHTNCVKFVRVFHGGLGAIVFGGLSTITPFTNFVAVDARYLIHRNKGSMPAKTKILIHSTVWALNQMPKRWSMPSTRKLSLKTCVESLKSVREPSLLLASPTTR